MKKKSSRIVALVLTLCMVFFGLPVAAMAEGNDVVSYNGGTPTNQVAATVTTSAGETDSYPTLQAAVNAARDGDTVTLSKNVVLDGTDKGNTQGLLLIDGDEIGGSRKIVIDGSSKKFTISAKNVTVQEDGKGPSMINVENGANVTFRNLTIDGAIGGTANTKHGLNIYEAFATVENVTIKNNRWYAIVANGSDLTVDGLTTEGNQWGINVDNKSDDASLVVNDANINEKSSIVFDKSSTEQNSLTGTIADGKFQYIVFNTNAENTELVISGGTFATESASSGTKPEGAVDISKHLALNMEQDADGNVVPEAGYNFVVSGMGGYESFDAALTAANAAEDGSTIVLWDNVNPLPLTAPLSINKDITITSAESGRKTITLTNNQGDRSKLIIMSADLTLNNVALTLKPTDEGYGDGIQMGSGLTNPVTLTLQNGAVLTFENNGNESVQNAFVMPAGAEAKVIVDNSEIIAKGVDGNFSNGGIFTIRKGSEVTINDCESYGLSVNGLTVDNSELTIDGTVLSAIRTSSTGAAVKVVNGGNITVKNSGSGLPRENQKYGDATGVIDIGHGNAQGATVPASLTVDEKSSIVLENNNNEEANFVYLTKDASYAVIGKVTKIEQDLPDGYYSITYTVNGKPYTVKSVSPDGTSSGTITFTEPANPVVSGDTFQGWNYPEGTEVENGTVTFPVEEGELAYTVTANMQKKSTSTTADDGLTLGYKLPYIGESTGGKNFVSDTTSNLTVNGKYQFRITSTDGHKPVMTVSNSNFTVELASQSGNDYFYVIRCAGAAGSTANVLVDGIHVVTATVGTAGVVSDTTHPFTVAQGAAYQFKLTSASRPTFTGNNANFTIAYVSNSGNDWFFKVTAAGAAGASTTFSANGVVVTTATIA